MAIKATPEPNPPLFGPRFSAAGMDMGHVGYFTLILVFAASFLGSAFLSFPLAGFHLYPYRILLIGLWVVWTVCICTGSPLIPHNILAVRNYFCFFGLWLAYSLLQAAMIQDLSAYIRYTVFLLMGLSIIFFMTYYTTTLRRLNAFYHIWLIALAILLGIGLWENLTGHHLQVSKNFLSEPPGAYVPTGTFKMTNHYASCLALSFPLVLSMLIFSAQKFKKIAALALGVCTVYLVNATGSRLCMMAICLQGGLALLFFVPRRARRNIFFTLIAVVLLLTFTLPPLQNKISTLCRQNFASAYRQVANMQGSGKIRINLALNGILYLRDSAGLGIGAGNFNTYVQKHPYFPTNSRNHPQAVLFPHNWWIELLAEYGVIIFLLYTAFLASLLARSIQSFKRSRNNTGRKLGAHITLSLSGFLVVCMAPGYFIAFRTQWILLAMAVAYVSICRQDESGGSRRSNPQEAASPVDHSGGASATLKYPSSIIRTHSSHS